MLGITVYKDVMSIVKMILFLPEKLKLRNVSKSFTVVIQPLSTRLIKPNFCLDLSHRRSTTVSLETRNSFTLCNIMHHGCSTERAWPETAISLAAGMHGIYRLVDPASQFW